MIDLLSGAFWPWAPPLGAGVVDVRDVALAHCLALVKESAKGRFLLVNQVRVRARTHARAHACVFVCVRWRERKRK
jgi:hypothetical protein